MFRGLKTAICTLTHLPFPGKNSSNFADSLSWFPLVGAIIAGVLWCEIKFINLVSIQNWYAGIAIILVITSTLITRGLHLDGVADWADAFWGGYTPQKRLKIMKDTYLGTFGSLGIILVILTKWAAYTKIMTVDALPMIFVALIISRMMMVEVAVSLPCAREDGTGAPFIQNAGKKQQLFTYLLGIILIGFISGLTGIGILFVAYCITKLLGRYYKKMVGGVTGDLLGVTNELIECACLLLPMFIIDKLNIQQFYFLTLL